jgi:hypothetical protein
LTVNAQPAKIVLLTWHPRLRAVNMAGMSGHWVGAGFEYTVTGPQVAESKPAIFPGALGFREGATSVHTSRTLMLAELSFVLERVPPTAKADAYPAAVVEENILGKPTQTTRKRTAQRLGELFALDPACPLFRLLRHFWPTDPPARPLLALLVASARDPLLREMTPFVVAVPVGTVLAPDEVATHLGGKYPGRFKPTTLLSTSQNLASSWTQVGYLTGKSKKKRSAVVVTTVVATFALLLGHLCGLRGRMLLDSPWTRLLGLTPADVGDLAVEASRQGWMTYKAAGAVVEITFPGLLKPHEEKAAHVPD